MLPSDSVSASAVKTDWAIGGWPPLIPAALAISVSLIFELYTAVSDIALDPETAQSLTALLAHAAPSQVIGITTGFILWVASATTWLLATCCVLGMGFGLIHQYRAWKEAMIVGVTLAVIVAIRITVRGPDFGPNLSTLLLQLTWQRLQLQWMANVIDAQNALASGSVAVVAVSAGALLKMSASEPFPDMGCRWRHLRLVLYFGATLLVTGVTEMAALISLPMNVLNHAPAVAPSSEVAALRELVRAVPVAAGALFTLLLLSIYGSAAVLLRRQAKYHAQQKVGRDHNAVEKQLEIWGLNATPLEQLRQILAAVAPLITGTAIPLLLPLL